MPNRAVCAADPEIEAKSSVMSYYCQCIMYAVVMYFNRKNLHITEAVFAFSNLCLKEIVHTYLRPFLLS